MKSTQNMQISMHKVLHFHIYMQGHTGIRYANWTTKETNWTHMHRLSRNYIKIEKNMQMKANKDMYARINM